MDKDHIKNKFGYAGTEPEIVVTSRAPVTQTDNESKAEQTTSFTQWLTDNGYQLWHARAKMDGNNTKYIKDGYSYRLDELIKKWQAEQTTEKGWISVEDRLPEVGLMVLTFGKEGAKQSYLTTYLEGTIGHRDGLKDTWFEYTSYGNCYKHLNVTHWMPLPTPPNNTKPQ